MPPEKQKSVNPKGFSQEKYVHAAAGALPAPAPAGTVLPGRRMFAFLIPCRPGVAPLKKKSYAHARCPRGTQNIFDGPRRMFD
jgi:hypothetical protein